MDQEIRIQGEPLPVPAMCRFVVDRPVYENRSFYFATKDSAEKSPLAARLFEIPGISNVLISHQSVTVSKSSPASWPQLGPHVGAAIRAHIASGERAVSLELEESLPPADELRSRVESVIASEVAPSVASHGGSIDIVDVKDNVVLLKMGGGCQGCSSATATLKFGVEASIRRAVPEIGDIIDTTDHSAGQNPYYTAGQA